MCRTNAAVGPLALTFSTRFFRVEARLSRLCAEIHTMAFACAAFICSGMVRECAQGLGVDRHLYGLQCQAVRHGLLGTVASSSTDAADKKAIPLFSCAAYKKLTATTISTSNCGNPSLQLFGFGCVRAPRMPGFLFAKLLWGNFSRLIHCGFG